jgi:RNase P/RNase MRP subunit p29
LFANKNTIKAIFLSISMKNFVGKKVKMIIQLGDTAIPISGIIKGMNKRWVEIEVNKKRRIVNTDIIAYIEEE